MSPLYRTIVTALALAAAQLCAQPRFNEELTHAMKYRNLGPFRAGGWVTDIAVPDAPLQAHLYTFYVGTRNGGVFKTTNGGDTFEAIFDQQDVLSIGAVAVSHKDENTVWVGTGDAYFARSPYFGSGVYKTTDGGKSWAHLGLEDTQHIAKIVIDPADSNIVYVAATGHGYTPNENRGVFKTTDGGKTWTKSFYIDDRTAAIDLAMDPKNPKILYAAMWRRNLRAAGEPVPVPPVAPADNGQGGIYKTTDGGKSWQKCTVGLPEKRVGRIGLAMYAKDPSIVYAILDNQNPRPGEAAETETAPGRGGSNQNGASGARRPRATGTEIYRTSDAGKTWRRMNTGDMAEISKAPNTFTMMRVDTENPDRIYALTDNLYYSEDGGKTWPGFQRARNPEQNDEAAAVGQRRNRPGVLLARNFGDFRTLWIDPSNAKRFLIGSDGGVFASYDGGQTSEHFPDLPLGEINSIAVDYDNPYHIYVGEQDHEHWKGPVNSWSGGVGPEEWITVGNGDGENDQVDPADSRWLYTTSENGQHWRVDQKNYTRKNILPVREPGKGVPYRFNWTAPIRLSPNDPAILYTGAQMLLRSMDRGDHWQEISGDLTLSPQQNAAPATTTSGGVIVGAAAPGGAGRGGTITTLGESPAKAGVIWVGSQNGRVHVTRDAGGTWTDVTSKIAAAGGPEDAYVTRVEPSRFDAGTAYVSKSLYSRDDPRPFIFKTTDFGQTWENISADLPQRSVNAVMEDAVNPKLLFAATDGGAYATIDGGQRWVSIRGNMPQVAVMDLVEQTREADLVLGSYGRGIWITNIAFLRHLKEDMLAENAYFFPVKPEGARVTRAMGNFRFYGDRSVITPNEPSGLKAVFYLKDAPKEPVILTVTDASGKELRHLTAQGKQGLNELVWDLREPGSAGRAAGRGGAAFTQASPGEYVMTLQVGDKKLTQPARVLEPVLMTPGK